MVDGASGVRIYKIYKIVVALSAEAVFHFFFASFLLDRCTTETYKPDALLLLLQEGRFLTQP